LIDEPTPDGDSHVCENCVSDVIVREMITSNETEDICDFCGESANCVSLSSLASILDEKYRELVRPGEYVPQYSSGSDSTEYTQVGDEPSSIIQEMLECENKLADALTSYLFESEKWLVADGDDPLYDNTSTYEFFDPTGYEYEAIWCEFCERIKHMSRFFDPYAKHLLDEVFKDIAKAAKDDDNLLICEINGEKEQPRLFRGRIVKDEKALERFCNNPDMELSAPPSKLATPGRMNPAGVRMFYGATNPETCLAELRCAAGDIVVVAEFKPVRHLRLLDVSAFGEIFNMNSCFDSMYLQTREQLKFLERFQEEICKPVRAGDEFIDYIPTQAVAEYLSKAFDPKIDGLMFDSSRIVEQSLDEIDFEYSQHGPSPYPEEGRNIVLFHHACEIETSKITNDVSGMKSDRDNKPITANNNMKEVEEGQEFLFDMSNHDLLDAAPETHLPSLELVDDSVTIVEIQGVIVRGSYTSAKYLQDNDPPEF